MFKTTSAPQLDFFNSPSNMFSGKSQMIYEDDNAWHNKFRIHVTNKIDEKIFKPLYSSVVGTKNASINLLVGMMIIKEGLGISDEKLLEDVRFNMLMRSALGLLNINDSVPSLSTYYSFRKKITEYKIATGKNLFELTSSALTSSQCVEFDVTGKRIRMDSKLMGSNIAWLSRYELIHDTFGLFYNDVKKSRLINTETALILNDMLALEGKKIVYTHTTQEVKDRLVKLGVLIHSVLPLFSDIHSHYYKILKRVFEEQYHLDENKIVLAREQATISAKSVQSPHDTECTFRNKDGNKVKGYVINVTESCDDTESLNLIGHVDVRVASASDKDFLEDNIRKVQAVFTQKTIFAHADGAYHSVDNQVFCKENEIELYLHAIQGAKGKFALELLNENLVVTHLETNEIIESKQFTDKKGDKKWRITTSNGYRYFTQKEIDTYQIRKKIATTPLEILQKRNNVEATIFQLGYHYPNAKSRYRGIIKHQMWANARCLWVNFVRIFKFISKNLLNNMFFKNNEQLFNTTTAFCLLLSFLFDLYPKNHRELVNIRF
jgi:hypothetical protein